MSLQNNDTKKNIIIQYIFLRQGKDTNTSPNGH